MLSNALVSGCNGFVGRCLTAYLHTSGRRVYGIDVQPEPWAHWLRYATTNITDSAAILALIKSQNIERIYHLAAVSNPRKAQETPLDALVTNVIGSTSFYEACRQVEGLRMLVVGSSEVYRKMGHQEILLQEDSVLEASNMYGATKLCSEIVGKSYVEQFRCSIVFTRSFNHTGPGQSTEFVLSDFAKQCAEIAEGKRVPAILVGNVDVQRDFLDVEDVVRAYDLLIQKGTSGQAYNVCSSKSYSLRDLLAHLISLTERTDISIEVDPSRVRQMDPAVIHGDSRKLRVATGWEPSIPIEETLRRLYEYWHHRVR